MEEEKERRSAKMQGDDSSGTATPLKFQSAPTPAAIQMTTRPEKTDGKAWNTRALPLRLGSDAIAAASAGVLVAPIITIIDR